MNAATVTLQVNGRTINAHIDPRTTLGDFLREHLKLTGTHLACEQGVCGACNVLLDEQTVRSCTTLAASCDGAILHSIEGFDDDEVMQAMRDAFSREHALQCGYCTPGMLIAARDVVLRHPDADEALVRREMSGNLCRCTGYAGIVAAVLAVLRERRAAGQALPLRIARVGPRPARDDPAKTVVSIPGATDRTPAATASDAKSAEQDAELPVRSRFQPSPNDLSLVRSIRFEQSVDAIWRLVADPRTVARCVPGFTLAEGSDDTRIDGRFGVGIGPIRATFVTRSWIELDTRNRRGVVVSEGRDRLTNTTFGSRLEYVLQAASAEGSDLRVEVSMRLSGALAQFARTGIVDSIADRLARQLTENLEALLSRPADASTSPGESQLRQAGGVRSWLRRVFGSRANGKQ